jgi:hypothetical protein
LADGVVVAAAQMSGMERIVDRRRPPQHPFKYLPLFRSSLAAEGDAALITPL